MIYVCRVDTGSRHIFDLADGIENVGSLVNKIESQFKIDKTKQILLISGGEVLDDYLRKFYGYGFGCEESPIYLIDKSNVEKNHPPVVELPLDFLCQDMKQELQTAISLRPSFQTIQTRSHLIHKINETDKNIVKLCQCYYDDQYWQYQGYLTLIANLDEFLSSFRKKVQAIHEQFEFFLKNSNTYKDLMNEISKYIEVLSHVPLVPSLSRLADEQSMAASAAASSDFNNDLASSLASRQVKMGAPSSNLFSCFSTQSIPSLQSMQSVKQTVVTTSNQNNGGSSNLNSPTGGVGTGICELAEEEENISTSGGSNDKKPPPTKSLLDWIKSTDPNNKLNAVIDETAEILTNLDTSLRWSELSASIGKLMTHIENNAQMREIEGLAKRLDDLKGFLIEANKFLVSQNELDESLQANLQRAANLRDETILQDLCKGHERQLEIFRNNHMNLIEIANKISRAKLELIRVVHTRLYMIMQIQKQVADYDFKVQLYYKQLKRFNVRVRLMEQIKKAPGVYVEAVRETMRRLRFSKAYKSFACLVIDLVRKIYDDEMKKRQQFEVRTSPPLPNQHFILNILFRSLSDKVDMFLATDTSNLKFDDQLPQIEEDELKSIEDELEKHLKLVENENKNTDSPSRDDDQVNNNKIVSSSSSLDDPNINILNRLVDLLGEEGHNNKKSQEDVAAKVKKEEEEEVKNTRVNAINESSVQMLKASLSELKSLLDVTKVDFLGSRNQVESSISRLVEYNKAETERKAKFYSSLIECLDKNSTVIDNSAALTVDDLDRNFVTNLVGRLDKSRSDAETRVNDLRQNMEQMKKTLGAEKQIQFNEAIKKLSADKDRQIDELKAKQTEYLNRICSLEKELLESRTITSSATSNAIMNHLTIQTSTLNAALITGSNETTTMTTTTTKAVASTTTDDIEESIMLGGSATTMGGTSGGDETKAKLRELMLKEKVRELEKQLAMLNTLPVTSNFYEAVQINSCNVDDLVLAVYSDEHASYRIIHRTSNYLHFVHSIIFKNCEHKLSVKVNMQELAKMTPVTSSASTTTTVTGAAAETPTSPTVDTVSAMIDSPPQTMTTAAEDNQLLSQLDNMNLASGSSSGDTAPFLSTWFIGKVLIKEFCIAKKDKNRFKVPSGTRFYRVKLKPYLY